ncbi:DUF602-domain-containing protein [Lojkania enalia]|uniref:DUF602-domain-containing protein n=1 Tax=Lojkania enalia TaxID=147567 RepID=A0A9P4N846_9PLEO|nr:DUF602-domain-containing protein [Didymosphaeria enalia]
MGNDGGSIPTRRELVKEAAKALTTTQIKEVQTEQQEYAWSNDPISRKPLARPVVSDSAGRLYNKETILEYLLSADDNGANKVEADKIIDGRVKSLKDVVEVKFEVDEEAKNSLQVSNGSTGRSERWICPITRTELGPGAKAVYIVPCGHAFAGSVVKEVSGETCLQCNEPYAENDIIPILPIATTDLASLNLRIRTLKDKGLTHALKKASGSKKRKKAEKETNGEPAEDGAKAKEPSSEEDKKKERKSKQAPATSNGIKNASTAYLTKRVLEEQEERNKKRKVEQNETVKSLFSNRGAKPSANNSADYMTRGFSIPSKK